jgi:hypothetical protein
MSLEKVQKSTYIYLSKLLEDESESFCNDLSDLVVALLENENGQFDDISNDMEPFLKNNTAVFMNWLKTYLTSVGFERGKGIQAEKNEEQQEEEEEEEEQEERMEQIVEKKKEEPKKGKSKLVYEETNSSKEQINNRMKRFGLPVAAESEPNKTRKLDNALPSRSSNKPKSNSGFKSDSIKEITIERPSTPTVLPKKDNLVFNVQSDHVVTKTNDQFTISFANTSAVAKLPQRCHFYPNCTKSDCPYLHPEIPCTTFPHCPYGATCRFIHPACKFADRCTKPGCPYTHSPFAKSDCKNGFACTGKGLGGTCQFKHPLVACKFGITCLNKAACIFSHAILCTYGASCKTSGCKFAHIVKAEEKNTQGLAAKQQQPQQTNGEVEVDVDVTELSNSLARTPPRDDTETNAT